MYLIALYFIAALIDGSSMKYTAYLCTAIFSLALPLAWGTAATLGRDAQQPAIDADQGPLWTRATRQEFYGLDQGSRIMPLAWFVALKRTDGTFFVHDGLSRYGFLRHENARDDALPIGFTTSAGSDGVVGMTCAACHTRELTAAGSRYRIDGGPAIIDFQAFLQDLNAAVASVLQDETSMRQFTIAVLGANSIDSGRIIALREELQNWQLRFDLLMRKSLPTPSWGLGRMDAVGMIFNRLTGLALGPDPHGIIEANLRPADAPVRNPFLWNADKQARTQWLGFADNRNATVALARNVGQVLGVFADFRPRKDATAPFGVDFSSRNSVQLPALQQLERLMAKIGPPRWPWPVDGKLVEEGRALYKQHCDSCHSASPDAAPWPTATYDVGSDVRQLTHLTRTSDPGVLEGLDIPGDDVPVLHAPHMTLQVLKTATIGSMIQQPPSPASPATESAALQETFEVASAGYEARVLHGIWAAAPYLHNGSVSTLADLLQPAAERRPAFKIGSAFDVDSVGLAADQSGITDVYVTTDCSARASGNSRCGHEYGTQLSGPEKRALLEYLKQL